jgi:hypothetical protein
MPELKWVRDKNGEALYADGEYVGCIYARDHVGGCEKGWRLLDADFQKVADVTMEMVDQTTQLLPFARGYLESVIAPLPTAHELLDQN